MVYSAVSLAVSEGGSYTIWAHTDTLLQLVRALELAWSRSQAWLFSTEVREDTVAKYRALFLSLLQTQPCCSLQLKSAF